MLVFPSALLDGLSACGIRASMDLTLMSRVQVQSKLVSLEKNSHHAISRHCTRCCSGLAHQLTNSVGRPKHTRVMAGAIQDTMFIGKRAQELRGLLKIKYPMEHGVVTDWDDMERIWGWVYGEGLKALSEEVGISRDIDIWKLITAPCTAHRSTSEPTSEPRRCCSDLLRNVQRTCVFHQCSSSPQLVSGSAARRAQVLTPDTPRAEQQVSCSTLVTV